jgi:hypothetical protein
MFDERFRNVSGDSRCVINHSMQHQPYPVLIVYLKVKNTISIRKFHDVWREANHATTSQLEAYIDAVVGNTTQGSVENRPQPSFVDNAYDQAIVGERALAFNRGVFGSVEQQATPNLLLPTTGVSNAFRAAKVSDNAFTANNSYFSDRAFQSLLAGR